MWWYNISSFHTCHGHDLYMMWSYLNRTTRSVWPVGLLHVNRPVVMDQVELIYMSRMHHDHTSISVVHRKITWLSLSLLLYFSSRSMEGRLLGSEIMFTWSIVSLFMWWVSPWKDLAVEPGFGWRNVLRHTIMLIMNETLAYLRWTLNSDDHDEK